MDIKPEQLERLDDVAEFLDKTPVTKHMELGKLVKFIKLLILEPILAFAIGGILLGAIDYRLSDGNDQKSQFLMFFSAVVFILILIVISTRIVLVAHYDNQYKIVSDKIKLWRDVAYSQESMRNGWINNWGKIVLKRLENAYNLQNLLLSSSINSTDKLSLLQETNNYIKETEEQYIDLWEHIDSDMDDFQIGMSKPLPQVELKQLHKLQKLYDRLNDITKTKE